MNTKKIIIILVIVALLLGTTALLLLRRNNTSTNSIAETVPTGIIVPTTQIQSNELDIIKIEPQDQSQNVELGKVITITFSRVFTDDEFEFVIDPPTIYTTQRVENSLLITPEKTWDPGTLYTYSINFKNDPEKVRLYKFYTAGPTQQFLPDTQPKGLYESEMEKQKQEYPDIYVANQTPYDAPSFHMISDYDPATDKFFFIVTPKVSNQEKVRSDVNLWLQSLDLTDQQINSLRIEYH